MKNKNKTDTVHLPYFGIPKIYPYVKPYKKVFALMLIFGVYGGVMDIVLPLFQKYSINNFIAQNSTDGLWLFALLYLFVIITQAFSNFISAYKACYVETSIGHDLRRECFNHVQTLSFSYFNRNSVGYIHSRIMSDPSRIGGNIAWDIMDGIWHISYILGAVFVMFSLNAKLALYVMIIVPFVVVTSIYFQKKLVKFGRKIRETNSLISSKFNEGITGIKTIKTLAVEDKIYSEFNDTVSDMRRFSVRAGHFRGLFRSLISFSATAALSLVLWRGGYITVNGLMTIGTLSVFMSYALGLMEPVQWIVNAFSSLINMQVNVERVTKLIATESDVVDSHEVTAKYGDTFNPKRENWESIKGDVEFRDVTFKYPDGEEYILRNFNLKIPHGKTLAIVGETGAGKSTLVNLVCRFFEPVEGSVLIDGVDVKKRSQLWLHSQIGYVLQTPHLFSGSIADNMRYGNPNASDEEILSALRLISADKIVDKLPNGLYSDVGEGGDLLSTGEKQLLSLARALISDPSIFVLDEATSSIDTETERLIQKATETVMNGRTSFIIAHRLSTIRKADIIISVKDGKILEQGTHEQLLKAKGYYYMLYKRQFEDEQTSNILNNK